MKSVWNIGQLRYILDAAETTIIPECPLKERNLGNPLTYVLLTDVPISFESHIRTGWRQEQGESL